MVPVEEDEVGWSRSERIREEGQGQILRRLVAVGWVQDAHSEELPLAIVWIVVCKRTSEQAEGPEMSL